MFDTAQHKVLYGIKAYRAQSQSVVHCAFDLLELEVLHESEDLHVLSLACLAHAGFEQTA